ncbi:superinfection immunity protein [Microbulbifer sp. OS29]|uniref:Superinfection immunity protein n=1 Tax=Microbulbifer okhotskensis TaxID=2926617 RepID=A0A9X2ETA0_9GAMM|nr:superinfection immunity protein [Microbulbifer okhotskensis]MCO1337100.1 superinfection immunity protein [Microbulbifer okhotskensis]
MEILSGISPLKGILFVFFFLLVWFLPAMLAFFLNRKHFRKILTANIPAGLSWVAWFALLVWAISGKVRNKKGGKELAAQKGSKVGETLDKNTASSGH